MVFLARQTAFAARRTFLNQQRLAFTNSAFRLAGKETAEPTQARQDEIENEKQDMLNKVRKDGKSDWKEKLASDSESAVKADRGDVDASPETIKKMQEDAKKSVEQQKKK